MGTKTDLILHRKSANIDAVNEIIKKLKKEGLIRKVLIPWNKSANKEMVSYALKKGAKRIIACGGDGTINAVVNSVVETAKPGKFPEIGIFPLGTANDFARGCNLPLDDLEECLRIACTGKSHSCDVGIMNDRYFLNVASAGFGAEITATTPTGLKKALGGAAYSLMGIIKAFEMSPYTGQMHLPNNTHIEGSITFMAVANNRFAGGGFEVGSHAKLDDGLLDLITIRTDNGLNPTDLAREINDLKNPDNQIVRYHQLEAFIIKFDEETYFNLDGEPLKGKVFNFAVKPRYLNVVF
ncbi:YegS/Rv2252/BmrU family lipid kinase [Kordiimonas sp. SCSIO 12610]|uniref:YegS/Rv2252/BmrU family lipid kinase n=1 Tax=Kordiimonas sp. SCSIO 12610 TaxID=2829597 RepID=UPI00210B9F81|nr:YegS/Rv2252/BmrU family lipid kinase [Kordiimonas sp. SCSIO 12610]UTW56495.1 YegS/Rv2252/BmrU family lipid kinase [Kordiimonas sp. SCSIO 12610]